MVKGTVNLDTITKMVKEENPDIKIKDIKRVLMSSLGSVTELLADGYAVKLHKTMKLEPRVQGAHKSYNGLNKTYYSRPTRAYVKLVELSYLKEALDEASKKLDE